MPTVGCGATEQMDLASIRVLVMEAMKNDGGKTKGSVTY